MEALLLIWFTHHDAFELRSLEGIFTIFVEPCLVDIFGRTHQPWDSLGFEYHRLDTKAHTLDDNDMPLEYQYTP